MFTRTFHHSKVLERCIIGVLAAGKFEKILHKPDSIQWVNDQRDGLTLECWDQKPFHEFRQIF